MWCATKPSSLTFFGSLNDVYSMTTQIGLFTHGFSQPIQCYTTHAYKYVSWCSFVIFWVDNHCGGTHVFKQCGLPSVVYVMESSPLKSRAVVIHILYAFMHLWWCRYDECVSRSQKEKSLVWDAWLWGTLFLVHLLVLKIFRKDALTHGVRAVERTYLIESSK